MDTNGVTFAVTRDVLIGLAPFGLGLLIVAALITAVWIGIRVRAREPAPPRPEDQPKVPKDGPVREIIENREPAEVPRTDEAHRLLPHELKDHGNTGTQRGRSQGRRRWRPGRSGSFGSGGP